ncbi:S-adenosyl-L-methionine-dependent methyltransferase [Lophium mytilinum]|uniref:S-adenosyl-L-methionine-dependent methyltransferase n=1 Tax=Lophium mytilinum TaxID=390894 RepID=A0A6A6QR66_9PEZI|nr:S-adenosyl-L-methionine-dependent methyltransferase [Lophium mytilinum]
MADDSVPAGALQQEQGSDLLEAYTSQSESDVDSAYNDIVSETASVTSSILAGKFENGRRYHAYGQQEYMFPDDEQEQDRLDIKYASINLVFGQGTDGTLFAPVKDPQTILDIGTGTGIWAIDCGEEYPGATVYATDLSPIQPAWVPPNVKFEIDDAEKPWTFDPNFFDVVHTRTMTGCIRDWQRLAQQAFVHIKPGGYLECQEMDYMTVVQSDSQNPGEAILLWCKQQGEAAAKAGISLRTSTSYLKTLMESVGFVDVVTREFKLPIGPWASDRTLRNAGLLQMSAMLEGMEGISLRLFTHYTNWTLEELHVLLAKCRTEIKDKRLHAYWTLPVVYGRKPE